MLTLDELERISRHHARELTPEETLRTEAWLAENAEARAALEKLEQLELDALVLGARRREEALQANAETPREENAEAAIDAAIARAKQSPAPESRSPSRQNQSVLRSRRSRWIALGAAGSAIAAAAVIAAILFSSREAPPPELRVLAGSARLNGVGLPAGARAPLSAPLTLTTSNEGVALLEMKGSRLLLAPRSELATPGADSSAIAPGRAQSGPAAHPLAPLFSLRQGTALADGPFLLDAGGAALALDGLAIVSREPLEAAAQATRALHNLDSGDPMTIKWSQAKWSGFPGALAGAAAAVFLASGDARATSNDGKAAALHAGQSWNAPQPIGAPAAALTANANPVKSPSSAAVPAPVAAKAPAKSADDNPDHAALLATSKDALLACFAPVEAWGDGPKAQLELEATLARDGAMERISEVRVISFKLTVTRAPFETDSVRDNRIDHVRSCLSGALKTHARFAPREVQTLQLLLAITPADGGISFDCPGGDAPPPVTPAPQAVSETGAPTEGPVGAPVTVVEFTDYQCSFCKHVNDTLLALQQLYGDKIRFVFKQDPLPFHENARRAAAAVLAANAQGQFAAYRKLVYYGGGDALTEATLEGYAQQVGLDLSRFKSDLASGRFDPQIDADLAEAKQLDIQGTPTFVINGQVLRGAQPVEEFTKLIDAALAAHN